MIKTVCRVEEVIDFVWELSQNNLYASYPRIQSREKTKETMEKAINADNDNVIACYHENVLCGVCIYFWKCDEKYAQTILFLIKEDYDKTAEELIAYISEQLPGYELYIGVPFHNEKANKYFKKNNIECIESSIVTKLYDLMLQYIEPGHEFIEKITENSFKEYAIFHDKHAIPLGMYYNGKNLKKDIEQFRVFAFKKEGAIHASIFVKAAKDMSEVVGLFIDGEYKNKGIESILIDEMLMQLYNEFGTINEIIYFVDEDCTDELNSVLTAGFQIEDKYRCYKYIF